MVNCENILFDLDGTLVNTQKAFKFWHDKARAYLSETLGILPSDLETRFNRYLKDSRRVAFVEPYRLISLTLQSLSHAYPGVDNSIWLHAKDLLWQVYSHPVEPYDEVDSVIHALVKDNYNLGIVTQSGKTWTEQVKMARLKINKHLVHGRCFCAPTHVPKDKFTWLNGAYFYGFNPEVTAVVGDNLIDDANAAQSAEFALCCWLNRANEDNWFFDNRHQKRDQVSEVTNLWVFLELVRRGRDLNPR